MTTQSKLTGTQTAIIKAVASRPDGNIEPLPATLRGGARTKVIECLLTKGLVASANGHYLLTDADYAAVGKRRPAPRGVQKTDSPDALTKHEVTHALQKLEATSRTIRSGTKLAAIIDALCHPGGATIAQMMAGTGWQAHTIRRAISGMVRKRLGYAVVTEKGADGQRAYRIVRLQTAQGYAGKVIQVNSSRSGAEEEEMITRLLAVESVDEPTEIVIHVNMLKEGWDVTNLYTIVPLRAANARTLIEQRIGRGLRLPYGKRTGVAAVDRLNIVAHDKFQEIIDEANRGDSPIRLKQVILDAPSADDRKVSVQVESGAAARLGLADTPVIDPASTAANSGGETVRAPAPVFTTEVEKQAACMVMDVIGKYEVKPDRAPTRGALLNPDVQKEILAEVTERLNCLSS